MLRKSKVECTLFVCIMLSTAVTVQVLKELIDRSVICHLRSCYIGEYFAEKQHSCNSSHQFSTVNFITVRVLNRVRGWKSQQFVFIQENRSSICPWNCNSEKCVILLKFILLKCGVPATQVHCRSKIFTRRITP